MSLASGSANTGRCMKGQLTIGGDRRKQSDVVPMFRRYFLRHHVLNYRADKRPTLAPSHCTLSNYSPTMASSLSRKENATSETSRTITALSLSQRLSPSSSTTISSVSRPNRLPLSPRYTFWCLRGRGMFTLQFGQIIPSICLEGTTPTFYKIPVTAELVRAVDLGAYPTEATIVCPQSTTPACRSEGMRPFDNRQTFICCFEAFKGVIGTV
jgi:hypothetical protein